jgi:hypothetical protein
MVISKSSRAVIGVGLIGCFLTSVAGVTAVMIFTGWAVHGGWAEWAKRMAIAYSAASMVVLAVFPWLVPKLMKLFMNSAEAE